MLLHKLYRDLVVALVQQLFSLGNCTFLFSKLQQQWLLTSKLRYTALSQHITIISKQQHNSQLHNKKLFRSNETTKKIDSFIQLHQLMTVIIADHHQIIQQYHLPPLYYLLAYVFPVVCSYVCMCICLLLLQLIIYCLEISKIARRLYFRRNRNYDP